MKRLKRKENRTGKRKAALLASAALNAFLDGEERSASELSQGHTVAPAGLCGTDVGELVILTPKKLFDGPFLCGFRRRWAVYAKDARAREARRRWLAKHLCCVVEVAWDGLYEVHAGDHPGPLILVKHASLLPAPSEARQAGRGGK